MFFGGALYLQLADGELVGLEADGGPLGGGAVALPPEGEGVPGGHGGGGEDGGLGGVPHDAVHHHTHRGVQVDTHVRLVKVQYQLVRAPEGPAKGVRRGSRGGQNQLVRAPEGPAHARGELSVKARRPPPSPSAKVLRRRYAGVTSVVCIG
eukprot:4044536-Pyramimonas_sp.AAC.1